MKDWSIMEEEELPYERELHQIKRLMRTEVASHDRIRTRVLELRERHHNGEIDAGATSWLEWAVAHFAYSERYLKQLLMPHPLSSANWERQKEKEQVELLWEQDKMEKDRRHLERKQELKRLKRENAAIRKRPKKWSPADLRELLKDLGILD